MVKINILDFILSIYLVQKYLDKWHPVAYYSCKITPLELNYNIYNKELLGIVTVFKKIKSLFIKNNKAIYSKNRL